MAFSPAFSAFRAPPPGNDRTGQVMAGITDLAKTGVDTMRERSRQKSEEDREAKRQQAEAERQSAAQAFQMQHQQRQLDQQTQLAQAAQAFQANRDMQNANADAGQRAMMDERYKREEERRHLADVMEMQTKEQIAAENNVRQFAQAQAALAARNPPKIVKNTVNDSNGLPVGWWGEDGSWNPYSPTSGPSGGSNTIIDSLDTPAKMGVTAPAPKEVTPKSAFSAFPKPMSLQQKQDLRQGDVNATSAFRMKNGETDFNMGEPYLHTDASNAHRNLPAEQQPSTEVAGSINRQRDFVNIQKAPPEVKDAMRKLGLTNIDIADPASLNYALGKGWADPRTQGHAKALHDYLRRGGMTVDETQVNQIKAAALQGQ